LVKKQLLFCAKGYKLTQPDHAITRQCREKGVWFPEHRREKEGKLGKRRAVADWGMQV